ncbi:uncharacterized protein LOC106640585 [Copidosoma floridanum]|uniref:uncharacterized protein LOC106640585 n=1 Tax=Copidosoma floridanum TaxID=29053 RepID=UPI0006C95B2D|nr:uncharacterized protein LOC106640585 [Copidosoma floridanum]
MATKPIKTIESSMKLPSFNGNQEDWESFKEIFEELVVENSNVSAIEAFRHLINCLGGEASEAIRGIQVMGDNFLLAWNTLQYRYANKNLRLRHHLRTLNDLPRMDLDTSGSLQYSLNVDRSSRSALEDLKCPVQHWGSVLIFFVENKLSLELRSEWWAAVGNKKNDDFPTFEEFELFLEKKILKCAAVEQVDAPADNGV